jgi:hypothetical protein
MRSGAPAPGRKLLRVTEDAGTIFVARRARTDQTGRQGRWPRI